MKNLAERIDMPTPTRAEVVPLKIPAAAKPQPKARWRLPLQNAFRRAVPAALGLVVTLVVWQIAALNSKGFPTPVATWQAALTLFADPFYSAGPNDQGIGWNVLASLQRVATGFGLAALVGIPAGFLLGRFAFLANMLNRSFRCCARSARWPGCRLACCCSSVRSRHQPGPFSSAPSGR
ncbi:Bicarbonate transport system permease protein CmpB [Serratia plymuthica]|uniref:Bicarbonate transport system permease protein CmpB n=1 Tax=Serratia plymuthica TaxID=82996 RepID=A0A2X4VAK1_SERPL|nr:Bicarbonate transport system permease protein CmpB [Serratia plymuthica]